MDNPISAIEAAAAAVEAAVGREVQSIEHTLFDRAKTHGDYDANAQIAEGIKDVFYRFAAEGGARLTAAERYTVDMIATKLGRIGAGDPHFADHWRDIAGYATVLLKRL